LESEKLEEKYNSALSYHEFDGTLGLYKTLHSLLGNGLFDVEHCYYDKNILIEAIYIDNTASDTFDKLVVVKRKIHENDTYTFCEFDPKIPEVDKYEYESVELSDIVKIIRNKYIVNGVMVRANGEMQNITYLSKTEEDGQYVEKMVVKVGDTEKTIRYLNIVNIMRELCEKEQLEQQQQLEKDQLEQQQLTIKNEEHIDIDKILADKLNESEASHLHMKRDAGLGIFNCYCQANGTVKNDMISNYIKEDIYGDVILGFENKMDNDERLLNLTVDLFKKIYALTNEFRVRNKNYCNVYYELL
jgi:hypothetical protein